MARYLGDDVQTALAKHRPWSLLPSRSGTEYGTLHTAELTSRVASADITGTLDQMAVEFDPTFDSAEGKVTPEDALRVLETRLRGAAGGEPA